MTLKEKYTIKSKKRTKEFIFLYLVLVIIFAMYFSFARYEKASEGRTKITVANWKIALNGKELTDNNNLLSDSIILSENKVKPGQTGSFDIEINPAGTEVSFYYEVALDLENSVLPEGLSISSYSLDGGNTINTLPENNTLSDTVLLGNKDIFTENDAQIIRYYWEWANGDEGDSAYTLVANVQLKQVI